MSNTNTKPNYLNKWLEDTKEYQAGKTFEYIEEKYGFKREEILRLAGNESTIGTSPQAIKAAQDACESSNFYDEPKSESLIKALENYHQIDISKIGIVAGNGMDSIIEHCLALFCNKESSIINLSPTFIYYEFAAKRAGIEIIDAPRKLEDSSFKICADSLIQSIKANTKLIFLCSPNNPDGSVISLEDIEKITKAALEKEIIVFLDHAYIDFTDKKKYEAKHLIERYPNLILGYTFSKAFGMAGYRVGYALMEKELQKKFLALTTPFLISKVSIAGAKAALLDKAHYQKILDNNFSEKPKLKSALEKLGFTCLNSEANFLLFYSDKNSKDLLEAFMSKGIIIREIQGITHKSSKLNALRVTIGSPEENLRFIKALKEILQ